MSDAKLLETGTLEPVREVAYRVTGKWPAASTVWRWCRRGLRGGKVKLACEYFSGKWYTTEAAFRRFLSAQTMAQLAYHGQHAPDTSDEALRAAGLL